MSLYQDMTYISLLGSRENVVRMLNAVIRTLGNGNVITDDDDLETINNMLKADDGRGFRIAIPDLLDEQCMEDVRLREKKAAFEKKMEEKRMIDILGVFDEGEKYRVELEMYECEGCAYYSDWLDWGDISRIYGCRVLVDNDLYRNGNFNKFCGTIVYTPKGDSIEETRIEPKLDLDGYFLEFNKLTNISEERYHERMIRCLESKIRELQYKVANERVRTVFMTLEENNGRAVIPEGVEELVAFPRYNAKALKSIYIPASVKFVSTNAFRASDLESIEIHPDNPYLTVEGNCILDKERKTLLYGFGKSVIPASVSRLEENAFSGCSGLREIVIPGNVESIGNHAFDSCRDLKRVVISEGVKEIGGAAFYACENLEEISLPKSVNTIYGAAFRDCTSLSSIVIPPGALYYDRINP